MFGYKAQATVGDQAYPAYELRRIISSLNKYLPEPEPKRQLAELFEELNLSRSQLLSSTKVYVWQVHLAMHYARLWLGRSAGALIGQEYQPRDLDLLLPHLSGCANLSDCLVLIINNPQLVGSFSDSVVQDNGDFLSIRWLNTSGLAKEVYCDLFVLSVTALMTVARQLTLAPVQFSVIELSCSANDITIGEDLAADIRFNSDICQWRIAKSWLALPVSTGVSALSVDDGAARDSISEQVINYLRDASPCMPAFATVAAALNMSERTLRRRLANAHCSYQVLLDLVRSQTALALIIQGQLSVSEIAEQMGYSDVCHFRQSFKHWLGLPPGYFRQ
ncbi:AraC family transcriptional regulator [Shewanella sp. SNU WT4]|uniref:helix-turn-helix transcriptional regulator n=1 Tax=Shewanella sp. SNU WT4 TaxID=2590015 RepID=UPI0011280ACB|nr:helix-turn-helix transcriptional regulator [Shewanella sp. SNU WT4]QDF67481.1 AraC family transcriptional regulator [Shewanella sp. SNU WT4]